MPSSLKLLFVLPPRSVRSRRDLLDHVIALNERHRQRLMRDYVRYYHEDRTHLALAKETPAGREAASNTGIDSGVITVPRLGGLHHCYNLAARAVPRQNTIRAKGDLILSQGAVLKMTFS